MRPSAVACSTGWGDAVCQSYSQCTPSGTADCSTVPSQQGADTAVGARPGEKNTVNKAYSELISITRTTLAQARQVVVALQNSTDLQAQRVVQQFAQFIPLVEQVVEQTIRRVLNGEAVPATSKVVSLFEPHTQIICRGKAPPHETEFGHKVNYAEAEGGFLVDWNIIAQGNPPDETLLPPALRHHIQLFGHAPDVLELV